MPVDRFVVSLSEFAIGSRFDADSRFQAATVLADGVGIVSWFGDDRSHLARCEGFQQVFGFRSIAALTGGQTQLDQSAVLSGRGVDFGCQSASGAAQAAAVVGVLFFSPGLRRPVEDTG